jgi:hypothetical protein
VSDDLGPVLTGSWYAPELADAEGLESEASREIGPGHSLRGHALTLIARCDGCDHAAFRLDDGRFAIVHLTWAGREEPPAWPSTEIFSGHRALEAAADEHSARHED